MPSALALCLPLLLSLVTQTWAEAEPDPVTLILASPPSSWSPPSSSLSSSWSSPGAYYYPDQAPFTQQTLALLRPQPGEYWLLIGQYWSRDLNTGLGLVNWSRDLNTGLLLVQTRLYIIFSKVMFSNNAIWQTCPEGTSSSRVSSSSDQCRHCPWPQTWSWVFLPMRIITLKGLPWLREGWPNPPEAALWPSLTIVNFHLYSHPFLCEATTTTTEESQTASEIIRGKNQFCVLYTCTLSLLQHWE